MSDLKQEFDQAMAQLTAAGAPYELGGDDEHGHFFLNAPATLPEALAVARNHGDREFLIYEGERSSFNELMARDPQNAWRVLNQAQPQTVANKLFVME